MTEFFPIIPGRLWQSGSVENAQDESEVLRLGIDYVVNLNGDMPFITTGDQPFTEVRWEIEDGPLPDLDTLNKIVDRVCAAIRAKHRVLVHCTAGLNRSGLVNAMVVNRLSGKSGPQLLQFMRRKRPGCLSNRRFAAFIERL